ncbi:hypothetical protein Ancab_039804 [Ancistrocladus abbreviatus]
MASSEIKSISSSLVVPQITTRKLNGKNYIQLAKSVTMFLKGQGKYAHLISDVPTGEEAKLKWEHDDAQIVNMLWNSMELEIADLCTHLDTCKDIWDYVRVLYSSNTTRMYDLSVELFQSNQGDRTVTQYFADLKRIHEELNVVLPVTADVRAMQKQREQLVTMKFLAGLKPEFDPVCSQILGSAELPSFAEVYARILRSSKEGHMGESSGASNVDLGDRSALAVHVGGEGRGFPRGARGGRGLGRGRGLPRKCAYCGREGHLRESCWDLIGRPSKVANAVTSTNISGSSGSVVMGTTSAPIDDHEHITISKEEFTKFLKYQSHQAATTPVASFANLGLEDEADDWRRA